MQAINSRVDGELVAYLYRGGAVSSSRESLDDATQILQSSVKRLPAGAQFRPHAHLPLVRDTVGTQEAWVVISGLVHAHVFDIDDTLLFEDTLAGGDCLVSFRGGHSMVTLETTLLYEFKNGPYFGQKHDKRWLS